MIRVVVGNIGTVECQTEHEAIETFAEYVIQSRDNYGRAAGEDVTILTLQGNIRFEYQGSIERSRAAKDWTSPSADPISDVAAIRDKLERA